MADFAGFIAFPFVTDFVKDFYLILFVELLLFVKPPIYTLSAVYFRLSVLSCLLFGSAFGGRMMLKDLKEAFKWILFKPGNFILKLILNFIL